MDLRDYPRRSFRPDRHFLLITETVGSDQNVGSGDEALSSPQYGIRVKFDHGARELRDARAGARITPRNSSVKRHVCGAPPEQ
jgi:hypothetical protein